MKILREAGKPIEVTELVKLLNAEKGEEFHANFDGAWDRNHVTLAKSIKINRGKGFESAVVVEGPDGLFIKGLKL